MLKKIISNKTIINTAAISFTLFILWVICTADTGGTIVFVKMIKFLPYPDKFGHFFLFGILAMLLNMALMFKTTQIFKHSIYTGSVLVFVFAILEELSQGFLPTRSMDHLDVFADALGIMLFTVITNYLKNRKTLTEGL